MSDARSICPECRGCGYGSSLLTPGACCDRCSGYGTVPPTGPQSIQLLVVDVPGDAYASGVALNIALRRLDPEEAWRVLDPKLAIALARRAPKVIGPWEVSGYSGGVVTQVARFNRMRDHAWHIDVDADGRCRETGMELEDAKAEIDGRLHAAGNLLDDGTS